MANKDRRGAAAKPVKPKAQAGKGGNAKARFAPTSRTVTSRGRAVTQAKPQYRPPKPPARHVLVVGPTGKARMVAEPIER
jgi:hypothetical protein